MQLITLIPAIWISFILAFFATIFAYKRVKPDSDATPKFLTGPVPLVMMLGAIAVFMLVQASDGALFSVAILAVLFAVLGTGAGHSFTTGIIPNTLVMTIAVLFVLFQLLENDWAATWPRLAHAALVLIAGMFGGKSAGMGAGAVKLLAALSLWVSLGFLPAFLAVAIFSSAVYGFFARRMVGADLVNIGPPIAFAFLPFLSL